jgi:hypothetical protein
MVSSASVHANAKFATALGSFPVSSDTVESEGQRMKQVEHSTVKTQKNSFKIKQPPKVADEVACNLFQES